MRSGSTMGLWIALTSAAAFGLSGPFAKSLLEIGWSPGAAVGVRIGGGALVLLIPVLLGLRGRWRTLRRNWLTLAIYGATAIALCQFFYFSAVQRMSVGVSLLLEYIAPVLIVGWLWLRTKRTPSTFTIVGSVIAMVGLMLVLDLSGDQRLDPLGVVFGLAAAVCVGVFFVMSAKADDDLPPLIMAGAGMVVGAVVILILGVVGVMPFAFEFRNVHLAGWQTHWMVPILGLVLVSTAFSYVTGIFAARSLGSKVASFAGLTEVMFAVLWAWLLLDELPSGIQLLGGSLIVVGVILVRIDEGRRRTGAADPLDQPNVVEPLPSGPGS
ncbi:EamA family transporter [Arthrobacter sp. JZ12]|uniref:EamA family transporter n=1 Tax=Arthrobacter sp. JZ12 TaxID=2654190 RepID=UPI002B466FA0|nr:DMT family transporter [Arthrobacter sp. JZ12]WRH26232.1 EamA family transporter [Arthrobacter sp. JZ12]